MKIFNLQEPLSRDTGDQPINKYTTFNMEMSHTQEHQPFARENPNPCKLAPYGITHDFYRVDARNLSGGNPERSFVRKRATQIQGDISARHIRPVELPLPLSTTDPPTSPATYAHFNEGNFDGNDNDGNDDDAAQYNGSDASEVGGVCVGIDSNNVRFHGKDNFGDSVSFKGNYDKNTHSNGNDTLNLNDKLNVNDNFNDKDSNDSQFNNHDNLYDNGIHNNHARFYGRDNFGGSVSLEGNDNKNTHSNDNDNLNFNDNFNFNFNDNFDDKDRNHSQFNDNDNVYGNDTNSDRFPPPPPRGRKRRQTTLWASQTGETNTSVSDSLVWLPDENSALKAPEHE